MAEIYEEDPSPIKASEDETNGTDHDEYRARFGPLVQAAVNGNWPDAKAFLRDNPQYVRQPITRDKETVLHIAAAAEHTTFIEGLLSSEFGMTPEDVAMQTSDRSTTLHYAAQSGNVRIAEQLVTKNNNLLLILDINEDTPLNVAAYQGHTHMVSYLLSWTPLEKLNVKKFNDLFHDTINNDMYGISLKILEGVPTKVAADTKCWLKALEMLAKKPFAIGSISTLPFWKSLLKYSGFKRFKGIYNKALTKTLAHQLVERLWKMVGIPDKQSPSKLGHFEMVNLIFDAAKVGNVEFIIILARSYPDLLRQIDANKMSIFHYAILYRHESVFNLIYEIGARKDILATYVNLSAENNMLHLAGKLAPLDRLNTVSRAALQMQRESLWFKEVEKIVPLSYVNMKNLNNKTPKEIFIEEHQYLREKAEMWMKDASNNSMVVATLIAAVVFAAAFTVPGGNKQEGTPILLRSTSFIIFFISNAIALFSSTASMLFFLSVFVSGYSEEDFGVLVPSKLLLGLATLLISILCMIVVFSAACILMYKSASSFSSLAPVVASALVGIPLTLFSVGQCHELFVDLFVSQYQSKFLFRPSKHRLFLRKTPVDQEWIDGKYEMQVKRKGSKIVEDSRDVEH